MRRILLALAFALLACSKSEEPMVEKIDGTAKVEGKSTKIATCRAFDDGGHAAVRIKLETGTDIVIDPAEGVRIDGKPPVDCKKNESKLESGVAGKSAWGTGTLTLVCKDPWLEVDVKYDCGAASRPSNQKK
jgi:hypothetical protein